MNLKEIRDNGIRLIPDEPLYLEEINSIQRETALAVIEEMTKWAYEFDVTDICNLQDMRDDLVYKLNELKKELS